MASASGAIAAQKTRVLGLYREMLRHAQNLPIAKRMDALSQIKSEFKANIAKSASSEVLAPLLAKAESKLGYLRIVSPRRGRVSQSAGQAQHWVLRDGELVEGYSKRARADFLDQRLDPDDIARHKRLLEFVFLPNSLL